MAYEAEFGFLQRALGKCRLQMLLLEPGAPRIHRLDRELRMHVDLPADYDRLFRSVLQLLQPRTIYKLTDQFLCCYLFMLPPDKPGHTIVVGPYLETEMTPQTILELMEHNSIPAQYHRYMQDYYASTPLLSAKSPLYNVLESYTELMWGDWQTYSVVDLNQEISSSVSPILRNNAAPPSNETLLNMQLMEKRYAGENELVQAISLGLSHKADALISQLTDISFERRLPDPVRNIKNYCIITNTLMRKAAESGGVHPLYLDSATSGFARKIEGISSPAEGRELLLEMSHSYCRLVKRHATLQYSLPVQKTILYIDSDLSCDLSLKTLAELQNINASYLSTLFKRETGQTLTDFVNQRRVQLALHLLSTTKLQIQTIAQHCGIPDINYFSKIFKKYTQMTPTEYRKNLHTTMDPLHRNG